MNPTAASISPGLPAGFSRSVLAALWLAVTLTSAYFAWYAEPRELARDPIARLEKASGEASYRSDEVLVWTPASGKETFVAGDHFATGEGGTALLVLEGDRRLELGPNSYVIFERRASGGVEELEISVLRGKVRADGKVRAKTAKRPARMTLATTERRLTLGNGATVDIGVLPGEADVAKTQGEVETVLLAATNRPARAVEDVAEVVKPDAGTSMDPTPKPDAKAKRSTAATSPASEAAERPRLTASVPGSTLWVPAGSKVWEIPLTVETAAKPRAPVRVGVEIRGLGERLLGTHPLTLKQATATTTIDLGKLGSLPPTVKLRPVYQTAAGAAQKTASGEAQVGIRMLPPADGSTYTVFNALLGGVANRSSAVLTGGAASGGSGIELQGSALLAKLLPWLVRSASLGIKAGSGPITSESVYVIRNGALVARAFPSANWQASARTLARIVGADVAISSSALALGGSRQFRHSVAKLKQLAAADTSLRLYFVVEGKVQSFNPALLANDPTTLDQLAQRGIGPFQSKITLLHHDQGGTAH